MPCSQSVPPRDQPRDLDRSFGLGPLFKRQRRARGRLPEAAREPRLQVRHRAKVHVDGPADDGGNVEIGDGEIIADKILIRTTAQSLAVLVTMSAADSMGSLILCSAILLGQVSGKSMGGLRLK